MLYGEGLLQKVSAQPAEIDFEILTRDHYGKLSREYLRINHKLESVKLAIDLGKLLHKKVKVYIEIEEE
jgi:hypothetical protein